MADRRPPGDGDAQLRGRRAHRSASRADLDYDHRGRPRADHRRRQSAGPRSADRGDARRRPRRQRRWDPARPMSRSRRPAGRGHPRDGQPARIQVTVTARSRPAGHRRRLSRRWDRLFGTDGIRGVANVDLRPTIAFALGRATAKRLAGARRRDRRRPGHAPLGRHVRGRHRRRRDEPRGRRPRRRRRADAGPRVPRPAAARTAAGIMVSASHNPADDNGLKVLDADGLKLDDAIEDELEALIWRRRRARRRRQRRRSAGGSRRVDSVERYLEHRRALAAVDRRQPADGSSSTARTAPAGVGRAASSRRPGRTVEAIHVEPDGININVDSGATAPASLARAVVRAGRGRRVRARRRRRPADRGRRRRPRSSMATRSSASWRSIG